MKKLILPLLLSLCFIAKASANEEINFICNLDELFFYGTSTEDPKTIKFPIEGSLTILSKSKEFIYDSDVIYGPFSGYYKSEGNKILFTQILVLKDFDGNAFKAKYDFSLDKIIGSFKYIISEDYPINNKYIKSMMHSGKCNKADKLF